MLRLPALPTESRWVPVLLLVTVLAVLLYTPLKVAGTGYLPPDDATRHAAKIIAGKPWTEILLLRPEAQCETHPGWDHILTAAQWVFGTDAGGLVAFSIVFLFLLIVLPPLLVVRRVEVVPMALLVLCVANFGMLERLLLGRPFLFTVAVPLVWAFAWRGLTAPAWAWRPATCLVLITALASYCHGTWYLLLLPLTACALASEWRATWRVALCLAVGTMAGALLTGQPVAHLWLAIDNLVLAVGQPADATSLVSELQPFAGEFGSVVAVALVILFRHRAGLQPLFTARDPVFLLMLIAWVLGFKYRRFWFDWGEPALIAWLCLQFQDFVEHHLPVQAWRRLAVTAGVCLGLFLAITADTGGRWSNSSKVRRLSLNNAEHKALLPDPGGIIYGDSMSVFYNTFFENPQAPWRYALGFESGFMRPEDLQVYRRLQATGFAYAEYAPWVRKMTPADRLIVTGPATDPPYIDGLDWHWVNPTYWIGRIKAAPAPH